MEPPPPSVYVDDPPELRVAPVLDAATLEMSLEDLSTCVMLTSTCALAQRMRRVAALFVPARPTNKRRRLPLGMLAGYHTRIAPTDNDLCVEAVL